MRGYPHIIFYFLFLFCSVVPKDISFRNFVIAEKPLNACVKAVKRQPLLRYSADINIFIFM